MDIDDLFDTDGERKGRGGRYRDDDDDDGRRRADDDHGHDDHGHDDRDEGPVRSRPRREGHGRGHDDDGGDSDELFDLDRLADVGRKVPANKVLLVVLAVPLVAAAVIFAIYVLPTLTHAGPNHAFSAVELVLGS
jgi:hypothetical protein